MAETLRPQPPVAYRWAVLIFVSIAMGGNYYIYDSINPLERIFIEHLRFSATEFGWLNASYSVAAVATLLIGGIVIRVADTVYDSSLATRVAQLRDRIQQRSLHEIQSGRDRFGTPERD